MLALFPAPTSRHHNPLEFVVADVQAAKYPTAARRNRDVEGMSIREPVLDLYRQLAVRFARYVGPGARQEDHQRPALSHCARWAV